MIKIAVISDIHGNILALEEVVKDIKKRNIDLIVNLGDHVSGPLWPKETLNYLKEQDWVQIAGNHERQLLTENPNDMGLSDQYAYQTLDKKDFEWLKKLPKNVKLENGIFAFHGSPTDDSIYFLETVENGRARLSDQKEIQERLDNTNSPILFCGHSHVPRVIEMPEGQLIINPGSVGIQAYDDVVPEEHVIEVGSPQARYAVMEKKNNKWIIDIIAIPYDYKKAATQALKNGRKDWEVGLLTGYFNI